MKVEVLVLGPLDTNTYILSKDRKCIIIDPADDAEKIVSFCSKYEVEEIIVTHHHFDHIGALEKLEKYYNIKHNTFLRKTFSYDIIKTPGHTDDSISIFFSEQNLLFSGDLIFYHSIGRYDFPNSNYNDLIKSLERYKILIKYHFPVVTSLIIRWSLPASSINPENILFFHSVLSGKET